MTDPIKTIGKKLTGTESRDCIHMAILPCQAGERIWGNQEVGFVHGSRTVVKQKSRCYGQKPIGKSDPFLERGVEEGEWFWVFLFPGTVTGMRHHWSHPDVDEPVEPSKSESEEWLRRFADVWNFDYDDMIDAAQESKGEGCVVAMGIDLHSRSELEPGDEELFWCHVGKLTGKEFDEAHKENFTWSCSC